jgi:hypothetical protein
VLWVERGGTMTGPVRPQHVPEKALQANIHDRSLTG